MKVAVAGVEHVADAQAVGGHDLVHAPEHVGQLGARDHAVHHHVGGRDAAVGAERGLAALPEELALGLVARGAHVAGPAVAAGLDHPLGLRLHAGRETVELDQQRGRRVARIAAAERVLHRLDRELVDHLHRGGHEAARDDGGDRLRRLVHLVENCQHCFYCLWLLEDAHHDLGRDAEGALGADEEADQVVALRVARLAADPHQLAVGQDHFEAEHVIGGHAVLERVRAARVVRDVAADRAGLLARGIRRIVEALRAHRPREVEVHQSRLHHRDLVLVVHLEHAVHPHERDDETALGRQAAAGEPGARAAGHERDALPAGDLDQGRHLLRAPREHHEVGEGAEEGEPVGLVDEQLFRIGEDAARTEQGLHLATEERLPGGAQGGHGGDYSIGVLAGRGGSPSRTRTCNPPVNSRMLYH